MVKIILYDNYVYFYISILFNQLMMNILVLFYFFFVIVVVVTAELWLEMISNQHEDQLEKYRQMSLRVRSFKDMQAAKRKPGEECMIEWNRVIKKMFDEYPGYKKP